MGPFRDLALTLRNCGHQHIFEVDEIFFEAVCEDVPLIARSSDILGGVRMSDQVNKDGRGEAKINLNNCLLIEVLLPVRMHSSANKRW